MSSTAIAWAMDSRLTGQTPDGARLVLLVLADHADPEGRNAFPSKDRVATRLGVTPKTVQRHLATLREAGLIALGDQQLVAHYRADRRPTVYDLAVSTKPRTNGGTAPSPRTGGQDATGGTGQDPRTGGQDADERGDSTVPQTKNVTNNSNPTPQAPRSDARRSQPVPCPACGEPVRMGREHRCRRSALADAKRTTPAPAPARSRTCTACGHLTDARIPACTRCGSLADDPTKGPPPPGYFDQVRQAIRHD